MKIIFGLDKFSCYRFRRPLILCIGNFDGVHRAHQRIIKTAVVRAQKMRGTSGVLTFYPHPRKVTSPENAPRQLTGIKHKLALISELGPDFCLVINFKKKLAGMSPEKFAEKFLRKKLSATEVVVGEKFNFGKNRSGNVSTLSAEGKKLGFKVISISAQKQNREIISSSRIRELVESGRLRIAEKMLGRRFSVLGTVIGGDRRGRRLGFPTANIDPHQEVVPPLGVYAVLVRLKDKTYPGMLNIGKRPTFKPKASSHAMEINIFDFSENIYRQDLEIFFVKKLREEKKFPGPRQLIDQLVKDKLAAKKALAGISG